MNHKVGFKNRFRSKLRGIKYLFMLYNSNKRQSEVEVTDRQIHIRDVGSILD
jgi:hypothetical protein